MYKTDEIPTMKEIKLVAELNATKKQLCTEKKVSSDLKQRLKLKAVSIDCQLIEIENLNDKSNAKNADLSKQLTALKNDNELTVRENTNLNKQFAALKEVNESLLQQITTLTRRNKIQKASTMTSNDEIAELMSTLIDNLLDKSNAKNADLSKQLAAMKEKNESTVRKNNDPFKQLAISIKEENESMARTNIDLANQLTAMKEENESTVRNSIDLSTQLIAMKGENESTVRENTDLRKQFVASKKDNESLLRRTAILARRDQIQKASIMTSNDEIDKLMTTVKDFQNRFKVLAFSLQEQHKRSLREEQQWNAERDILKGCIQKLKSDNDEMKSKFIETLRKHQSAWYLERDALQDQITELLLETKKKNALKESIKETMELLKISNTIDTIDTADTDDKSSSQTAHELRNDLNNAERQFREANEHSGRLLFPTELISPSSSQEEYLNDVDIRDAACNTSGTYEHTS